MHFMLQKEVVERMVAVPGSSEFGRISVMLQYRFHIEWLLDVPPESFDPPPKVQSAVVRLIPRAASELAARTQAKFARLVRQPLRSAARCCATLSGACSMTHGFAELGIDPTCRAEEIAVADYVRMANFLT